MADELGNVVEDQDTDDTLVVDEQEDEAGEQQDSEQTDGETSGEEATDEAAEQAEDDEVIITLGEETPLPEEDDKTAAPWVRDLRKSNREKDRRIRELEQKLKAAPDAQPAAVVLGDKPSLEACDYDADKFERELEAWHTRKRELDDRQRSKTEAEEKLRTQWKARLDAVTTAGSALKVKDYDDAAQAFEDQFSIVQQGIIVGGPADPKASALLRYALGKNPKKAKELAAIEDPIKFAFAVANLEKQLKVTPRKAAPPPERTVRSSVAGAAAVDNQLQRLRDEAAKTGDMTKVLAYKNAQRSKK